MSAPSQALTPVSCRYFERNIGAYGDLKISQQDSDTPDFTAQEMLHGMNNEVHIYIVAILWV